MLFVTTISYSEKIILAQPKALNILTCSSIAYSLASPFDFVLFIRKFFLYEFEYLQATLWHAAYTEEVAQ